MNNDEKEKWLKEGYSVILPKSDEMKMALFNHNNTNSYMKIETISIEEYKEKYEQDI